MHMKVGYRVAYNSPFPGSSAGKESACNAGDPGSICGSGRSPGEGIGYPLQYSCLENPRGQRCLMGYSPQGHKESDKTRRLVSFIFNTERLGYEIPKALLEDSV